MPGPGDRTDFENEVEESILDVTEDEDDMTDPEDAPEEDREEDE